MAETFFDTYTDTSSYTYEKSELDISVGMIVGIAIVVNIFAPFVIYLVCLPFGFTVVEKGTAIIVERFGKYKATYYDGLHYLWPLVDQRRSIVMRESVTKVNHSGSPIDHAKQTRLPVIDLRERVLEFPLQSVITRDNVELQVHPMILYRIHEPIRVAYEVYDLSHCMEKLVQCSLRSIIGDMGLDDTLASREEINRALRLRINNVFQIWGAELMRVELLEIIPSPSIKNAMFKQLEAERNRRAMIVKADGDRMGTKTEAEGERQEIVALSYGQQHVTIINAGAKADAKLAIGEAEAQQIRVIGDAFKEVGTDPTDYLIGLKYMEAFVGISKGASKRTIYMPIEFDVAGAVADLN